MQQLQLHVNAVEATNLPKTDFLGASDPYVEFHVSGVSSIQATRIIENTINPIWNQEFHFLLLPDNLGSLFGEIKSKSLGTDDKIVGKFEIPLKNLSIGKVYDHQYKIITESGNQSSDSKIRLLVQIAPMGYPAFVQMGVEQPMQQKQYIMFQKYQNFQGYPPRPM